jgi:hypothetical protein
VKHITATGCGSAFDIHEIGIFMGSSNSYVTNSLVAHNYITNMQVNYNSTNMGQSIWEYNISDANWSTSGNHGETLNMKNCHQNLGGECASGTTACTEALCSEGNTIRYNSLTHCIIMCIAWHNPRHDAAPNTKVYGNILQRDGGGNGVIAIADSLTTYMHDAKIYNNTIIDSTGTLFLLCQDDCSGATGNEFKNNLVWNSSGTINKSTGTLDNDYNSYLSGTNSPTETNGQIASFNPFVSSGTGNYHLANGTSVTAGLTLASPYTTDPDGLTRGNDGTWDRGAYEFDPSIAPPPPHRFAPGINLRLAQ